jgi:hypothetical protein
LDSIVFKAATKKNVTGRGLSEDCLVNLVGLEGRFMKSIVFAAFKTGPKNAENVLFKKN